ncbi:carbohydrate ABC transporter permease [Cohnella sp. AR92]|nr:carbohydrate ABC transporter permease [Cohnella sp. AR92]
MRSNGDRVFDVVNYTVITLFALVCLFPFVYVAAFSITPYTEYLQNPLKLIPSHAEFGAYRQIFKMTVLWTGYRNTILITVAGVLINIFLMLITAYPLSKRDLKGRNVALILITFTMFFNGGLIPNFYLIRSLHLYNSLWSLILPGALGAYNLILMKNFISNIPPSLEESASIDGANEVTILAKIIIPLSKPAIATFVIFHAVSQWNLFFNAVIYTSKRELWPLMLIVRDLVVDSGAVARDTSDAVNTGVTEFTIKMAIIIFSTLPILLIFPFMQKYFMKGILIGSIKG